MTMDTDGTHGYTNADVALPGTPAGEWLGAFLASFNHGDVAAMRRFISDHYIKERRERHAAELRWWQDGTLYRLSGGLAVRKITSSSPGEITVLAQARDSDLCVYVTLWVTASTPRRIALVEVWPITHPANALTRAGRRHLAIRHQGTGPVTVVFEGGIGCASDLWDWVVDGVACFAHIVCYDRASLGESGPARTPRTCADLVADLHALLKKEHVPAPYVLVGHAFGAFITRRYAAQFPHDTCGLVLIDPTHPNQWERLAALLPPSAADESDDLAELRRQLTVDLADPSANLEGIDVQASVGQLRAATLPANLPLMLLASERRRCACLPDAAGHRAASARYCLNDVPPSVRMALQRERQGLYGDLLHLSTRGAYIGADHSEHMLPLEQPELVIAALRRLVLEATHDETGTARHQAEATDKAEAAHHQAEAIDEG